MELMEPEEKVIENLWKRPEETKGDDRPKVVRNFYKWRLDRQQKREFIWNQLIPLKIVSRQRWQTNLILNFQSLNYKFLKLWNLKKMFFNLFFSTAYCPMSTGEEAGNVIKKETIYFKQSDNQIQKVIVLYWVETLIDIENINGPD